MLFFVEIEKEEFINFDFSETLIKRPFVLDDNRNYDNEGPEEFWCVTDRSVFN